MIVLLVLVIVFVKNAVMDEEIGVITLSRAVGKIDMKHFCTSERLFYDKQGSPMSFNILPSSDRNMIVELIKAGGGVVIDGTAAEGTGAITISSGAQVIENVKEMISSSYIYVCCFYGELVDMEEFRFLSDPGVAADEKNDCLSDQSETRLSLEEMHRILIYIRNSEHLWKEMEESKVCGNKPWKSIQQEFTLWALKKFHRIASSNAGNACDLNVLDHQYQSMNGCHGVNLAKNSRVDMNELPSPEMVHEESVENLLGSQKGSGSTESGSKKPQAYSLRKNNLPCKDKIPCPEVAHEENGEMNLGSEKGSNSIENGSNEPQAYSLRKRNPPCMDKVPCPEMVHGENKENLLGSQKGSGRIESSSEKPQACTSRDSNPLYEDMVCDSEEEDVSPHDVRKRVAGRLSAVIDDESASESEGQEGGFKHCEREVIHTDCKEKVAVGGSKKESGKEVVAGNSRDKDVIDCVVVAGNSEISRKMRARGAMSRNNTPRACNEWLSKGDTSVRWGILDVVTSTPVVRALSEVDSSDEVEEEAGSESKTSASSSRPKIPFNQRLYSHKEDMEILRWLCCKRRSDSLKGNRIWQFMASRKVIPGRSWQSMKERFRRHIAPNIKDYHIPPEDKEKLLRQLR